MTLAIGEGSPIAKRSLNGRLVNPVGLGCMTLSWAYASPPSEADGAKLLLHALDNGYDHFDTARIYGEGHNETLIGKTLAHRRSEFILASKTGIFVDGKARRIDCRPASIKAACEESLRLLKTDHIDLYYLHRPDQTVPIEESVGALVELIDEGKIGSIGLSEMSAETVRRACAVHQVAALQSEYSPWTRNPEIAALDACEELGVTFVAFSPVGRGALADVGLDPAVMVDHDIRRTMPRFMADNWGHNAKIISAFADLATAHGVTPAQLALGWVLAQRENIVAIPGTVNLDHASENIARWNWRPDADLLEKVSALFSSSNVKGERYSAAAQSTVTTEQYE